MEFQKLNNECHNCTRKEADHLQISRCKEVLKGSSSDFKSMGRILAITGNEGRLKILFLLHLEKELCPCDLADILEMSVPAISQHLRKIKDAGLIDSRREGQTLYYYLVEKNPNVLKDIFNHVPVATKFA